MVARHNQNPTEKGIEKNKIEKMTKVSATERVKEIDRQKLPSGYQLLKQCTFLQAQKFLLLQSDT